MLGGFRIGMAAGAEQRGGVVKGLHLIAAKGPDARREYHVIPLAVRDAVKGEHAGVVVIGDFQGVRYILAQNGGIVIA